jgi:hypothetical protein
MNSFTPEPVGQPVVGMDFDEISKIATPIPPESRDAFAQLATQGRLPGQDVELRFVPIHDLQRRRVATFFCSPVFCVEDVSLIYGYRAFQGIGSRELPFIDRAILAHAVKFARKLANAGTVAAIGTSVNFVTLSSPGGRDLYQRALCAAGVSDCPFLVLKIEDVPAGTSAAELGEIVNFLRPYVKRIFVHVPDTETALHSANYLGASGLVLSLPPRPSRMMIMGAAKWLLRECTVQTAHSCIDVIDDDETLELIRAAGIRFGAGPVFGSREFRGDAHPSAIEYYMAETARSAARAGAAPAPYEARGA